MVSDMHKVAYFLKSVICDNKCSAFVRETGNNLNCNIYRITSRLYIGIKEKSVLNAFYTNIDNMICINSTKEKKNEHMLKIFM